MKSIIIALILILGQSSFASSNENINIEHQGVYNELDDSEQSKLGLLIDNFVKKEIYETGFESESSSIEVKYTCSQVPTMLVFCSVTITTEGGGLVALAVTYNRYEDEPKITAASKDF